MSEQLYMASIAFPKDRRVLTVKEVAELWGVSDRHVVNLIEEGKLLAFDISGRRDYVRAPMTALESISKQTGVPVATLLEIIRAAKPATRKSPSFWKIPAEGYEGFLLENNSLAVGGK